MGNVIASHAAVDGILVDVVHILVLQPKPEPSVFSVLSIKLRIDRHCRRSHKQRVDLAQILEHTGDRPLPVRTQRCAAHDPPPTGTVDRNLFLLRVEQRQVLQRFDSIKSAPPSRVWRVVDILVLFKDVDGVELLPFRRHDNPVDNQW